MIFAITIVAILIFGMRVSHKYKVNTGDGIAFSGAAAILILYVLAFFQGMKLIGAISLIYICGLAVYNLFIQKKSCGKLRDYFSDPLVPFLVITVLIVTILTEKQVFTWWDDINFWSSDAKQLYFLNGFPGKYGNVSPEFGDYPPVTSIFKWLFLQISPAAYKESLQFAGYFALNLVFLMPLAGKFQKWIDEGLGLRGLKRFGLSCVCFMAVALLPGVFNGIIYYGTPADITMGIVYGALLLGILEHEGINENFYYCRIALFTAVLFLTKSVGVEWAVFAFVFYLLIAQKNRKIIPAALFAGGVYGSWLFFCLINRRVAKLTGAGIKMATSGTYTAPQNALDKAKYFIEGFWTMPMHADSNITFDISTGVVVVCIFLFLYIIKKKNLVDKNEFKKILVFLLLTGILCYGIIFLAHISIFQTEDQYLDAYAMAVSIARYACPFALGAFYLLAGAFCTRSVQGSDKRTAWLGVAFLAFILLTADYTGVYKHLWGYRKDVVENTDYCYDMVGDSGRILVDKVSETDELRGKRVLVMRDGHTYTWVHDTYISKEASPVALVYNGYLAEQEDSAAMADKIITSHASYIYVEDENGQAKELFSPLMDENVTFEAGTIYKVVTTDGGIILTSL
jgi:hypothetical protein